MMTEVERRRTFMAEVVMRRGKEGKSAYITIPLPVRNLLGLRGGEILQVSILSVEEPKTKEK